MRNPVSSLEVGEIENKIGSMSEAEMRSWVDSLSDDAIKAVHANRYHPVYLNLLAIFHDKLSIAEITRIAAQCTRNAIWSNRVLDRWMEMLPDAVITDNQPLTRLKGFDASYVRSLCSDSNGVIICSFRLGQYSLLPLEIAMHGFEVVWPVKDAIFPELDSLQQSLTRRLAGLPQERSTDTDTTDVRVQNARLMSFLPVGDKTTTLKLVQTLRRRGIVLMQADGNGGVSGARGTGSRKSVQFMNFPVSVKTGIAHLAWATNAPILPMIATMEGRDGGQVICGTPIFRPDSHAPEVREQFEQDTMQKLYSFFEEYALKYPEQWPGVAPVHRWRRGPAAVPPPAVMSREEAGTHVRRELAEGGRYILNESSGVAAVSGENSWILVDMKSLKSFKSPSWANGVMQTLCTEDGLSGSAIERQISNNLCLDDVLRLLTEFRRQGLIAVA